MRWLQRFALGPTDLLRDATYRRLWTSILISSFGGQVTLLALPLSAAVLLHASPTQMGMLSAAELFPFVAVLAADRRVARSGAQAAGLRRGRTVDRDHRGDGAVGVVARLAVDAVAVFRGIRDRRGEHDGGQRRANRADADRAARTAGRGTCEKRPGILDRGGDRARRRGSLDQGDGRAARAVGRCLPAADLGVDSARRAGEGDGRARSIRRSGRPCARDCTSCAATSC